MIDAVWISEYLVINSHVSFLGGTSESYGFIVSCETCLAPTWYPKEHISSDGYFLKYGCGPTSMECSSREALNRATALRKGNTRRWKSRNRSTEEGTLGSSRSSSNKRSRKASYQSSNMWNSGCNSNDHSPFTINRLDELIRIHLGTTVANILASNAFWIYVRYYGSCRLQFR